MNNKLFKYILLCLILLPLSAFAQSNYDLPRYDISSYGTGKEGTYTAKVSVYEKKPGKETDRALRRCAVHGVIFKGLAAGNGGRAQRPMATAADEKDNQAFFDKFFADDATCLRYAYVIEGSLRVEKVDKKEYRSSAIIVIQKDDLRHYLEDNHVIESFNNLF